MVRPVVSIASQMVEHRIKLGYVLPLVGEKSDEGSYEHDGVTASGKYDEVVGDKSLTSAVTDHQLAINYIAPLVGEQTDSVTVAFSDVQYGPTAYSAAVSGKNLATAVGEHELALSYVRPVVGNKGDTANVVFDGVEETVSYATIANKSLTSNVARNNQYVNKLVAAYNLPRTGIKERPAYNMPDPATDPKYIYVIPSRDTYVVIPHDQPSNTFVMLPQILNE